MTKQQKARAHLARAQELIQDTLAFGVNEEPIAPDVARTGAKYDFDNYVLDLINLPDDVILKTISELNGARLLMLLKIPNHKLNKIIKDMLIMKSKTYTPYQLSLIKDLNFVSLLLKHGEKKEHPFLFIIAIVCGNTKLVNVLLDAGQDANQMFDGYTTPLGLSIENNMYNIAKILIEHSECGADVNKKVYHDEDRSVQVTPLDLAFKRYLSYGDETGDELSFVKYLLEKGADPEKMIYLRQRRYSKTFKNRVLQHSEPKDSNLLDLLEKHGMQKAAQNGAPSGVPNPSAKS